MTSPDVIVNIEAGNDAKRSEGLAKQRRRPCRPQDDRVGGARRMTGRIHTTNCLTSLATDDISNRKANAFELRAVEASVKIAKLYAHLNTASTSLAAP